MEFTLEQTKSWDGLLLSRFINQVAERNVKHQPLVIFIMKTHSSLNTLEYGLWATRSHSTSGGDHRYAHFSTKTVKHSLLHKHHQVRSLPRVEEFVLKITNLYHWPPEDLTICLSLSHGSLGLDCLSSTSLPQPVLTLLWRTPGKARSDGHHPWVASGPGGCPGGDHVGLVASAALPGWLLPHSVRTQGLNPLY